MNDHCEGSAGACREYTLSPDDPESEVKLWIHGHTRIGPVLQVKTTCFLDIYRIEIQIPSTSGDVFNILGCYVQRLKQLRRIVGVLRKLMRDSQQLNRIFWAIIPMFIFRLPKGSGMTFLPTRIAKDTLWNPASRELVMKLVRHLDQKERETDGAVHWKSMVRDTRFKNKGDGFIISGKEATNFDSIIVRTPTTFYCTFASFKGTLETYVIAPEVMSLFHSDGWNSCFIEVLLLREINPRGRHWIPWGDENNCKWKVSQDAVLWILLARHKKRD